MFPIRTVEYAIQVYSKDGLYLQIHLTVVADNNRIGPK